MSNIDVENILSGLESINLDNTKEALKLINTSQVKLLKELDHFQYKIEEENFAEDFASLVASALDKYESLGNINITNATIDTADVSTINVSKELFLSTVNSKYTNKITSNRIYFENTNSALSSAWDIPHGYLDFNEGPIEQGLYLFSTGAISMLGYEEIRLYTTGEMSLRSSGDMDLVANSSTANPEIYIQADGDVKIRSQSRDIVMRATYVYLGNFSDPFCNTTTRIQGNCAIGNASNDVALYIYGDVWINGTKEYSA